MGSWEGGERDEGEGDEGKEEREEEEVDDNDFDFSVEVDKLSMDKFCLIVLYSSSPHFGQRYLVLMYI